MGKFDGYLICSDIDGTLTNNQRKISLENKEAIRYFQENGGLFTVATGRYPWYPLEFQADFLPNAPMVTSNGAALYDVERDCAVRTMAITEDLYGRLEEVITYAFDVLKTTDELCLGGTEESIGNYIRRDYQIPMGQEHVFHDYRRVKNAREILVELRASKEPLLRVFFVQNPVATQENYSLMKERFGDCFTIVTGWECGIECLPKGCDKGRMIRELKAYLGNRVHTVVAVGDFDNDIAMLQAADIGYAVENAPDFVKIHADRITVSNEHSAIAKVIADIDKSI